MVLTYDVLQVTHDAVRCAEEGAMEEEMTFAQLMSDAARVFWTVFKPTERVNAFMNELLETTRDSPLEYMGIFPSLITAS